MKPREYSPVGKPPIRPPAQQPKTTSWGKVANWYNNLVNTGPGTYQYDVILPHLLRLIEPKKGERIADIACGSGFFSHAFAEKGAAVHGVDISPELIAFAKKQAGSKAEFTASNAEHMPFLPDASFDAATIVLAIQNMEKPGDVLKECRRILKPGGRLYLVMNHPTFRVPKSSSWGFDESANVEYRRLDAYMSEAKLGIEMHPGDNPNIKTLSFHRPLQFFFKLFYKQRFAVTRLEEWISNRVGPAGKRFQANDRARKEIPLFLCLELIKLP